MLTATAAPVVHLASRHSVDSAHGSGAGPEGGKSEVRAPVRSVGAEPWANERLLNSGLLDAIMRERNVSSGALALLLGVDVKTVQRWRGGGRFSPAAIKGSVGVELRRQIDFVEGWRAAA